MISILENDNAILKNNHAILKNNHDILKNYNDILKNCKLFWKKIKLLYYSFSFRLDILLSRDASGGYACCPCPVRSLDMAMACKFSRQRNSTSSYWQ